MRPMGLDLVQAARQEHIDYQHKQDRIAELFTGQIKRDLAPFKNALNELSATWKQHQSDLERLKSKCDRFSKRQYILLSKKISSTLKRSLEIESSLKKQKSSPTEISQQLNIIAQDLEMSKVNVAIFVKCKAKLKEKIRHIGNGLKQWTLNLKQDSQGIVARIIELEKNSLSLSESRSTTTPSADNRTPHHYFKKVTGYAPPSTVLSVRPSDQLPSAEIKKHTR